MPSSGLTAAFTAAAPLLAGPHAPPSFLSPHTRAASPRRAAPPRRAVIRAVSSPGGDASDASDEADARPRRRRSDDGSRDSEFDIGDAPAALEDLDEGGVEKNELYEFVRQVSPPEMVSRFAEAAPKVVQNAIRQTIVSMLGSLPSAAFAPRITTVSANLIQLMHSSLISGYMMRNAAYRLELTRNLSDVTSGSVPLLAGAEAQPEIVGGEAVFKNEDGEEVRIPMEDYVSELRSQVTELRGELERERKGGNELLSYISTLETKSLEALTNKAGEEVVDAMKRVVTAVTKAQGIPTQPEAIIDASSSELGQVLLYLMCCGFTLRETEVRVELQRSLDGSSASGKGLLGGADSDNDNQKGD